jgi:chromosomal replication initiation ATPase DnaA
MNGHQTRVRARVRQSIRAIIATVAARHGLTEADIYVRDRSGPVSVARRAAWTSAHAAGFSKAEIARVGGWNHSSICHAVRQ